MADKEKNEFKAGKLIYVRDDREKIYVDSFYELMKRLLKRVAEQTVVTYEGDL